MDPQISPPAELPHEHSRRRHSAAWGAMFAGAALSAYGWTRKSVSGAALGVAGGAIALKAASAGPIADMIGSERSCCCSVLILRRADELYSFWKEINKAPLWMQQISSASRIDERRTRWLHSQRGEGMREWTTEIIDDVPSQHIAWRTVHERHHNHEVSGSVEFRPLANRRGTHVTLTLCYRLRAGLLHAGTAPIIGGNPEQEMRENMRRFKMLMEAGEIATIQGQSHGPRKQKGRLMESLLREEPKPRAASAEAS